MSGISPRARFSISNSSGIRAIACAILRASSFIIFGLLK